MIDYKIIANCSFLCIGGNPMRSNTTSNCTVTTDEPPTDDSGVSKTNLLRTAILCEYL